MHRNQAEVAVCSVQTPAGFRSSRQHCGNIQRLESNRRTDVFGRSRSLGARIVPVTGAL